MLINKKKKAEFIFSLSGSLLASAITSANLPGVQQSDHLKQSCRGRGWLHKVDWRVVIDFIQK